PNRQPRNEPTRGPANARTPRTREHANARTRERPERANARTRQRIGYIGPMTISERADELEEQLMKTLDRIPSKSALYTMGEIDPRIGMVRPPLQPGQHMLQGADPRLPAMPDKPGLLDFFHLRFRQGGVQHLLQSANLA